MDPNTPQNLPPSGPSDGDPTSEHDLDVLSELDGLLDSVFSDGPHSPDTPIDITAPEEASYMEELRSIFRLAVKDHLRPVVTYTNYLLRGEPTQEAVEGLLSVLPPVVEAAGEVGMGDFAGILERMYALVKPHKDEDPPQLDEETLRELGFNLSCIPAMLEIGRQDSLHREITSDPEFEDLTHTLHSIQNLVPDTVHKLLRAGLTTPKSLLVNRVPEIVDVTGIDKETVGQIVAAVKGSPAGQRILAARRSAREHVSVSQLKELEVKLTRALRIREKIVMKLSRQRKLMLQIQRENSKLETYFLGLTEKLKTLQLAEDEIQGEANEEHADTELMQLRIRIRSIRRQIEEITQHNARKRADSNILMSRISQLQSRYKRFVVAEEEMISDLEVNREQLSHLKESITAVKRDLMMRRASKQ